jgi:hypothetical protein
LPLFFLCCGCLVFFLFSYDLPPFFATLDFVFLLADASPFLLDFFLVAIISMIYARTIINDLLVGIRETSVILTHFNVLTTIDT